MTPGSRPELQPGGAETFGISKPLIARWPAQIKSPVKAHEPCHVVDIKATVLAAASANYPSEYGGHPIQSPDGENLLPLMQGADWTREAPIYWEHEGTPAMRALEAVCLAALNLNEFVYID